MPGCPPGVVPGIICRVRGLCSCFSRAFTSRRTASVSVRTSWSGGGCIVFLADLCPGPDFGEELLLGPEVVGQQPLERPGPVRQFQFTGRVLAVVPDGLADDVPDFCSTWAPSFLFTDRDRFNVSFFCPHQRKSS